MRWLTPAGRRLAPALLFCALAACDEPADAAPATTDIELRFATGGATALVTVAGGTLTREQAVCPGADTGHVACTATGVTLLRPDAPVSVTIKADGFETRSLTVDPAVSAGGTVDAALTPLPDVVQNADYATGFGPDDRERFASYGLASHTELGPTTTVKFYIADLATTPRVYFQQTNRHPLHFDFARNVLGESGTAADFYARTYVGAGRSGFAGSLVWYRGLDVPLANSSDRLVAPIAVTFFPSDDLTPAQADQALALLEARLQFADLTGGGPDRVVYLPAGQLHEDALKADAATFDDRGDGWVTRSQLWGGQRLQVLNAGEAFGTLRRLTPEELETTVVSWTDILVLTRLPNELPIVGGTISEEFQTPLAHVNVAARARGTPNLAWLDAATNPRITDHLGQLVHLVAGDGTFAITPATQAEAQAWWDARRPDPIPLPCDTSRTDLPSFDEVGHTDAGVIGVKAANLAELHQLMPEIAGAGFAVPFAHYEAFMRTQRPTAALCDEAAADCADEGRPAPVCAQAQALCTRQATEATSLLDYVDRLEADSAFASDSAVREAALDGLRYQIRHLPVDADWARTLDARVTALFGEAGVRLRSSTNAEDLADFSGAGLYSSYSACGTGCPDAASDEIRKVWASAWNWSAHEERSWWGIEHHSVCMGVAVSPAYPDEAANGVLITQNIADPNIAGMYVNVQLGEVSVTNPTDGSIPEVFSLVPGPGNQGADVARLRFSSLSDQVPILTDAEVDALFAAATRVQNHFAPLYDASPWSLALDIEFKFVGSERRLIFKQVRPFAMR